MVVVKLYDKVLFEEFTQKWILVPEERNAFILHHQHGRYDVTCKLAIKIPYNFSLLFGLVFLQPLQVYNILIYSTCSANYNGKALQLIFL